MYLNCLLIRFKECELNFFLFCVLLHRNCNSLKFEFAFTMGYILEAALCSKMSLLDVTGFTFTRNDLGMVPSCLFPCCGEHSGSSDHKSQLTTSRKVTCTVAVNKKLTYRFPFDDSATERAI